MMPYRIIYIYIYIYRWLEQHPDGYGGVHRVCPRHGPHARAPTATEPIPSLQETQRLVMCNMHMYL